MRSIFILIMLLGSPCHAQTPSYENALKLYQDQNYVEAEAAFRTFAQKEPDNKFVFYNWGLAAYRAGMKGLALGAWRRALTLDPDFKPALDALRFAKTEMPTEVFDDTANRWETLRAAILERTTLDRFWGLTILFFIFSATLLLKYFGARRRALRDETPLPPFPTVGVAFAAAFVISLGLFFAKWVADHEVRATIVKPDIAVRSGPSDQDNILFELIEGSQVIVRRQHDSWTMVTYPGGLSGWVPTESFIVTSGRL